MTDRATEAMKKRRAGPSAVQERRIYRHHFETADDVYTTCQRCGEQRVGTLEELKQPCECDHG